MYDWLASLAPRLLAEPLNKVQTAVGTKVLYITIHQLNQPVCFLLRKALAYFSTSSRSRLTAELMVLMAETMASASLSRANGSKLVVRMPSIVKEKQ